jgi:hypothetical protein
MARSYDMLQKKGSTKVAFDFAFALKIVALVIDY